MVNTELTLERRTQVDLGDDFRHWRCDTPQIGLISLTPPVGEDYWAYRVLLSEHQAVIGFPKFSTVGIGFAVEDEDWNTNLPYTCDADEIASHIAENKGDPEIPDESVIEAIKLIQAAIVEDRQAQA